MIKGVEAHGPAGVTSKIAVWAYITTCVFGALQGTWQINELHWSAGSSCSSSLGVHNSVCLWYLAGH